MTTTRLARHSLSALSPLRAIPLAASTLLALLALPASAQTLPASSAGASGVTELQQVLVTGTRRANRTLAESESPVDVIGARELQSSGSSELATVLGQLLPSLNFPRPSVTDASDAVRPAQLRGLSPDQTLVLVDGKRRHTTSVVNINGSQGRGSSPVDLNAIPVAAIERIEVLRDGAAAQYGSDAIAGVINIVLKKGAKSNSLGLDVGQTDEGDGFRVAGSTSLGFSLGDAGWARVSLESRKQDFTNRAGVDTRDASTEPRKGLINNRVGDPDSKQNAAILNGQLDLGNGLQAYAFGSLSRRETSAAAFWRTAATAKANNVSSIYPEGFLPLQESTTTDTGLVLGVRGELAQWRWDASLNHGSNEFKMDVNHTANYSLGAASPTHFYAGALKNQQTLANLDLSREIDAGLASPLTLALGAEARHEQYDITAGELNSYASGGASGFPGFQPSNAGSHSRHSESVYASVESSLTKALSGSLALRGEHYSDFGKASSVKLSSRYVFSPAVALRGTASTGFRAPSLSQQYFATTSTNLISGVLVDAGTFPVTSAAAAALGAVQLKAEKSRNISVGVLLQPTRDWQTTVDAYQIDIDNRILLSATLTLPTALRSALAAQGVLVSAGRYFTNALDTRTRGIDVVSTVHQDWQDWGRSDFSLAYNHNKNTVEHVADNPALLTANSLPLIDRVTLARATVGSPKDKLVLSADHTYGAWNARLGATRYGSFTTRGTTETFDQTFGPAWVADVSVGWRSGGLSATIGVDNLNNRYPDRVIAANASGGIFQYSNFSPFGFNGRQYYGRVSYNW
jgi:iron complex outermembrane receptor protein